MQAAQVRLDPISHTTVNSPLTNSPNWLSNFHALILTLILLTWRIWWAPNNARKWQMGFNSAFKGLNKKICENNECSNIHHSIVAAKYIIMCLSETNHFYTHLTAVTIFHSIIHFCYISFIYLFIYLLQVKHFLKLALQYLGPFYAGLLWFTTGRTKFRNIQDGKRVTITNCTDATHTHLVIIQQSTVLVYSVHSTIIYKYFSTNSKKDTGKNRILICNWCPLTES